MSKKKRIPSAKGKRYPNIKYRFVALLLTCLVLAVGYLASQRDEAIPSDLLDVNLTQAITDTLELDKSDSDKSTVEKSNQATTKPITEPTIEPTIEPTTTPVEEPTYSEVSTLRVHFIDVGQADSILIESDGKFMLVDGGNNADKNVVLNYLSEVGVTRLEYIIGTHPHEDHIGALDDVIKAYDMDKIYAPHVEHTSNTYYYFLEAAIQKDQSLRQAKVGSSVMLGGSTVTFLAPNKDYENDLNNWSIGIKVSNGVHSFVMCGDAEEEAEKDIIANGIDIKADVLKLGHHGSSTSSSDAFLEAVSPQYAVISVGEDNSYGHPHRETIQKLKEKNIGLYRTDEQGTIIATSDGNELTWSVEN